MVNVPLNVGRVVKLVAPLTVRLLKVVTKFPFTLSVPANTMVLPPVPDTKPDNEPLLVKLPPVAMVKVCGNPLEPVNTAEGPILMLEMVAAPSRVTLVPEPTSTIFILAKLKLPAPKFCAPVELKLMVPAVKVLNPELANEPLMPLELAVNSMELLPVMLKVPVPLKLRVPKVTMPELTERLPAVILLASVRPDDEVLVTVMFTPEMRVLVSVPLLTAVVPG